MHIVVGLLVLTAATAGDRGTLQNLIPYPKHLVHGSGRIDRFVVDGADGFHRSLYPPDAFLADDAPVRIRLCLWHDLPADQRCALPAGADRVASDPEAYVIDLRTDGGWIVAGSRRGLQHGLATLRQACILAADAAAGLPEMTIIDWPDAKLRGAHVCYHLIREWMPYSAPSFDELNCTLERFAQFKFNTVLLELEAMFPFQRHRQLRAACGFTPEQIRVLVKTCADLQIEMIPLVQSLGHQYYLLSREQYAEFRETPDKIQQLCPTDPAAAGLVLELVDEYRARIPGLRYFHVGGDEARQLGDCPRCRAKVEKEGVSALYVDHVAKVCAGVRQRALTPIIWSDMLENHPDCRDRIAKTTVIGYWNYDFAGWPRAYALPAFVQAGYPVIAFPGIRFGQGVAHVSVNYPLAMPGIAALTGAALEERVLGIITTNWMKGIPFDLCWRGYGYAAWEPWTHGKSQAEYDCAFAALWYGLYGDGGKAMIEAYERLAIPVPYAEDTGRRLRDGLQRLDLSGLSLEQRIRDYSAPPKRQETLAQLALAQENAAQTLAHLKTVRGHTRRHFGEWRLLDLGARTLVHKSTMGQIFDQCAAWERTDITLDATARRALRDAIDQCKTEWALLREETRSLLAETHDGLCATAMATMKFEMDAFRALEACQHRLLQAEDRPK